MILAIIKEINIPALINDVHLQQIIDSYNPQKSMDVCCEMMERPLAAFQEILSQMKRFLQWTNRFIMTP